MIKKATYLAAAAAGYVLGARAGRERYEQIRTQARKVWNDPHVQQAAADAQDYAAQQVPVVKDRARSAAETAAEKVGVVADKAEDKAGEVADKAADKASRAADKVEDKTSAAADKVTGSKNDTDDLEGVDLVAAASDVPDPRDD